MLRLHCKKGFNARNTQKDFNGYRAGDSGYATCPLNLIFFDKDINEKLSVTYCDVGECI